MVATKAWIVDDDDIFRFIMKKHFSVQKFSHDIETFINGAEAINTLKERMSNIQEIPDVIFLDINMPVMTGWGFMDEFNKVYDKLAKKVSVYMVSSSVDTRDVSKAENMPTIAEYIVKPLDNEKVRQVMTKNAAA